MQVRVDGLQHLTWYIFIFEKFQLYNYAKTNNAHTESFKRNRTVPINFFQSKLLILTNFKIFCFILRNIKWTFILNIPDKSLNLIKMVTTRRITISVKVKSSKIVDLNSMELEICIGEISVKIVFLVIDIPHI